MGNKDPTSQRVVQMDRLVIGIEEVLFRQALTKRLGLFWRGVSEPTHQLGHQGLVAQTCRWFNLEFALGYDELLILQMGLDHDTGDLVKQRSNPFPDKLPASKLPGFVEQLVSAGGSYKERVGEYQEISQKLPPLFEGMPRVWEATDHSLNLYFRRPQKLLGSFHNEAWFVHNVGKISDVHLALWHGRNGDMEVSGRNIRTFTERMAKRVRDEIARLYWERVKIHYSRELRQVYRLSERALSQ